MIAFSNIQKWFGQYHALVDFSAEVKRGEVVVVCGPSGSGKSTLLRTVNRLEEIQGGVITFDGQDIHAKGIAVRRPQYYARAQAGVEAERARGKGSGMALLDRVGLSSKVDAYPGQLSGGQQQRVAIARALAMNPPPKA